jgi:hypothetical protein
MAASSFFRGVLDSIFGITRNTFRRRIWKGDGWSLHRLRMEIRSHFTVGWGAGAGSSLLDGDYGEEWVRFVTEVHRIGGVVIALVARTFPLFLVPSSREVLDRLEPQTEVRMRRNPRGGWRFTTFRGEELFSFELPPVLFSMYADSGVLSREQAALMKEQLFSDLQAVVFRGDTLQLVQFHPEPDWFERLRTNSRERASQISSND